MNTLNISPEVKHNAPIIQGVARVGKRTKELVRRLKPGEIAVIHHEDIDALAARALIQCNVIAVVNAAMSSTGRYPNTGPMLIVSAGIPLIDNVGEDFFNAVKDGDTLKIEGDDVECGFARIKADRINIEKAQALLKAGQDNIGRELTGFAQNTLEHMNTEWRSFFEPLPIPDINIIMRDKHVVVIARGPGFEEDVWAIRSYIRDMKPILIAVDGAADYLMSIGLKPKVIIGDMDSVSNKALFSGAEIIAHGYTNSTKPSPGWERCEKLGLNAKLIRAPGTSEDVAILMAYELGASLIVAVGSHFSLEEFLDKGRAGMSSAFLTRLKTGAKIVDAKGVSRLFGRKNSFLDYGLLILGALITVLTASLLSPFGQTIIAAVRTWLRLRY